MWDLGAAASLGPNQLGSGEQPWRACVYQGIEAHIIPKAFAPEAYRRAIATDRAMTERVAAGQMTRAERRPGIQALFKDIDREEQAIAARLRTNEIRRHEETARMRDLRRTLIQPLGR